MDINLPMINGLEAAKMIRIHNPSQIIILNSGYAEFNLQQTVQDQLIFLLKPAPEDKTCLPSSAAKVSKAGPKMETNAVLWEEFRLRSGTHQRPADERLQAL